MKQKELNPVFIATLGIIAAIAVAGLLIGQFVSIDKQIKELQARPVAIMPTEIVTPTASPTATLVPTRLPIRIVTVAPTK